MLPRGTPFKRIFLSALILFAAFFLYSRHEDFEEESSFRWFDRPVMFVVAPLSKGVFSIKQGIASIFHRYFFLVGLEEKNKGLEQKIDDLHQRMIFLEDLKKENSHLKTLLELRGKTEGDWIAAEVTAYPPFGPYRMMTVNKGSEDGVMRRSPVIAAGGLVGQVARVSARQSQVLLITDPTSSVDAYVGDLTRGLLVGKVMKLGLKNDVFISALEYLNQAVAIEQGTLVVTSGLDGLFPKGIPIGTIHSSQKKKYDIFQQAEVVPSVNFYQLREVLIFKKP